MQVDIWVGGKVNFDSANIAEMSRRAHRLLRPKATATFTSDDEDGDKDDTETWDELDEEERVAAAVLGWNEALWSASLEDKSVSTPTFDSAWAELTEAERAAAVALGYDETGEEWEEERREA